MRNISGNHALFGPGINLDLKPPSTPPNLIIKVWYVGFHVCLRSRYKTLDGWSSTKSAKKWIVSLKYLSSYSCTVTNLLSFITELARFTEAVYHYHEHRRSRGEGGERMAMASYGLWNVEVSRKLQKKLFSVVLS